jgi:hypothetical protein
MCRRRLSGYIRLFATGALSHSDRCQLRVLANATTPWTSATTTVATVSGTTTAGTAYAVTGATNGQTSVITYNDNHNCTATATVTVDVPAITGTLSLCSGGNTPLTGSALGAANTTTPWTSASTTVATVSGASTTGTVYAVSGAANGQTSNHHL